jgi:hypothetical protein
MVTSSWRHGPDPTVRGGTGQRGLDPVSAGQIRPGFIMANLIQCSKPASTQKDKFLIFLLVIRVWFLLEFLVQFAFAF